MPSGSLDPVPSNLTATPLAGCFGLDLNDAIGNSSTVTGCDFVAWLPKLSVIVSVTVYVPGAL